MAVNKYSQRNLAWSGSRGRAEKRDRADGVPQLGVSSSIPFGWEATSPLCGKPASIGENVYAGAASFARPRASGALGKCASQVIDTLYSTACRTKGA